MTPGRAALAVFGRPVVPGRVKTRLAARLGPAAAAALYRAFLEDTLALAAAARGATPTFWVAGDPAHPSLADLAPRMPRRRQPDGDLGARMAAALAAGLASHPAAVVVGSDAPTLPPARIEAAVAALARAAWAVVPAADGGFVLVASREPWPDGALEGARWSSPHALEDTRDRLAPALGPPAVLDPWYDVDTAEDLGRLRAELAAAGGAAPSTRAALRAVLREEPRGRGG